MPNSPDRDSKLPNGGHLPQAQSVPVYHGELLLVGWAIRSDAVLVIASGLGKGTRVEIEGTKVTPQSIGETTKAPKSWEPLTVLLLKPGTLPIDGDHFPPGFLTWRNPDIPLTNPSWCKIFPWLPGC